MIDKYNYDLIINLNKNTRNVKSKRKINETKYFRVKIQIFYCPYAMRKIFFPMDYLLKISEKNYIKYFFLICKIN